MFKKDMKIAYIQWVLNSLATNFGYQDIYDKKKT